MFDHMQTMIDLKKFLKSHESQLHPHDNTQKKSETISFSSVLSKVKASTSPYNKGHTAQNQPEPKNDIVCHFPPCAHITPLEKTHVTNILFNPCDNLKPDDDVCFDFDEVTDTAFSKTSQAKKISTIQRNNFLTFLEDELKKMWRLPLRNIHMQIQCDQGWVDVFLTFNTNNQATARFIANNDDIFDFLCQHKDIFEKILNTSPLQAQSYDIVFLRS